MTGILLNWKKKTGEVRLTLKFNLKSCLSLRLVMSYGRKGLESVTKVW